MARPKGSKNKPKELKRLKNLPQITWRDKTFREMDKHEMKKALILLEEGWKAELPEQMLYTFTGLDKERIEEFKRRNKKIALMEESYKDYLKTAARINVAKDITEEGDVGTSKWLLEHTDDEFKPASKVDLRANKVIVPIEDKEKEIEELFKEFFSESTESVTGDGESDRAVADGSDSEPLQKD